MSYRKHSNGYSEKPPPDWSYEYDAVGYAKKTFKPRLNLYEDGDDSKKSTVVTVIFEFPGLKREDIVLHLLHSELTVSGEWVDQHTLGGEKQCTIRQLLHGKFKRVLTVPLGLESGDIKARMENGLLKLTYPKYAPNKKPDTILIE